MDVITSPLSDNPEHLMINREDYSRLEGQMSEVLSELEQQVLVLYLEGHSYNEISKFIEPLNVKSIDNALQRIKRKLERHLEFGELS